MAKQDRPLEYRRCSAHDYLWLDPDFAVECDLPAEHQPTTEHHDPHYGNWSER